MAQDHVVISEIVLQPGNAEYIKISNPTDNPIDLSNYYLTDATDTANQKYYYNLPNVTNSWSGTGSDFIARFPQGFIIAAKSEIIIGATTTAAYQAYYGTAPDLAVKDDLDDALVGQNTKGSAPAYLDNAAETLVLFYWDGSSPTVKDVDYILWGSCVCAVDKSGISGYQNDTPVDQQTFTPTHQDGQKLQRSGDEGSEPSSGGNGITGHDETGEDLSATWQVVSVGNTKPKLSNLIYTPLNPTINQAITFSVNVTDDGPIKEVNLIYTFQSVTDTAEMALTVGSTYSTTIGPFAAADTLYYQVEAQDTSGLIGASNLSTIIIKELPEVLTIKTIHDNWDDFKGESVTLRGIVTIGSNILSISRTNAYFQDFSRRGLNLFSWSLTDLKQGDSIEVTGLLDEYNGLKELKDFTYTKLDSNVQIENIPLVNISELMEWEGYYIQLHCVVTARADNVGGGSNITVEDVTGSTTLRIYNDANILVNSIGIVVNNYLDSLIQIGNMISVKAVCSIYNNAPQTVLGYASDVEPYIPGEAGTGRTKITAAPYPFVPKLGEVIKYTYEYPANCRAIIRVYDLSGRFITTLVDSYFAVSWKRDGFWDGRNQLNQLVPPGNYLLHLQTTNRSTGKSKESIAPVVIGVKFR